MKEKLEKEKAAGVTLMLRWQMDERYEVSLVHI